MPNGSARTVAWAVPGSEGSSLSHRNILLVAEGLDRVKSGSAGGGVESGEKTDNDGEADAEENEPVWNGSDFDAGEILSVQIDIGAESQDAPNQPAENGAKNSAKKAHYASFHEKQLLNVAVRGAESF